MQAIVSLLDNPVDVVSLSTFSDLTKGAPAPHWLFRGVCGAWGIEPERAELNLITVSENATFVLLLDGRPEGVVRVSQPGYVGGPEAVASEIAWLAALHEIDGVRLIDPVPTVRGTFVTKIRDLNGVGWMVVSTKFVEGTVLEDLDDPRGTTARSANGRPSSMNNRATGTARLVSNGSTGASATWWVHPRAGAAGKPRI